MPKLKTNRAAAKRFRKTAKGFKRYSSRRRHNLGDKPRKQKRHLRSGRHDSRARDGRSSRRAVAAEREDQPAQTRDAVCGEGRS